jgi:sarcosine/dimethylglycine N-methyltransferase
MNNYATSINNHYGKAGLFDRISAMLTDGGVNLEALTCDDLTAYDELHIGGRGETRNLAKLAGVSEGKEVLDVGSGIGGPARTLANEFGAQVTGLDITEEFCRTAYEFTERVGLSDNVSFHCGSALEMPFEDEGYDIVWTQFTAMNIHDRSTLYREMFRVLRPGGTLAIHEIMGANDTPLKFPVLWAGDESISFIKPTTWVRNELAEVGFREKLWNDLTEFSIRWFEKKMEVSQDGKTASVSAALSGDANFAERAGNVTQGLRDGSIVVIQTIWEKPAR